MRGRAILVITAGCVLLAGAVILLCCRESEPSYKGRPLAQWIKASSQAPDDRDAHEAIVWFATNHCPVLLRWAFAETNQRFYTMPRVSRLIFKLPFSLTQNPFARRLLYRDNEIARAACALRAFEIAGTNAACAVPALGAMMIDQNPQAQIDAIHVCSLIGPPAVPAIRRAMTSPLPFIRSAAIGSLKSFGTSAIEAIPDLLKALSDYDIEVRENATNVLETLRPAAFTNTPSK